MEQNTTNTPQALPNSTTVLVLGICSIATCWCVGLVGLGCGITALIMSKRARLTYESYPEGTFTESSYNNMKAGKICGIIGVCLSSLAIMYFIVYFLIIGLAFSSAAMHSPYYY